MTELNQESLDNLLKQYNLYSMTTDFLELFGDNLKVADNNRMSPQDLVNLHLTSMTELVATFCFDILNMPIEDFIDVMTKAHSFKVKQDGRIN